MGIVQHRKYTNKHFKDNVVDLASNTPKLGHLTNQKKKNGENQVVEGILKHVIIDRIDSNGWVVEVGSDSHKSTYNCTNPQWALSLPDSTKTETMYVPKHKTRVEFSIDKTHKIYTILRVIGGKSSLSNYQDTLKISVDQNDKTNKNISAEITVTASDIQLGAESIILAANGKKIDLVQTQEAQSNQIKILIDENILLKERLSSIEKKINGAE